MDRLSDTEVDFILNDLKSKGIKSEDLRDNLLDHICCIIESERKEESDFYNLYEAILPRFFKAKIAEIQIETDNLLTFKHFYTMKTVLKYSGIATVVLTLLGAIFKSMHWPGAGVLVVLGAFFFSVIFMPLLIILKMKDDESKTEKAVFSFGFLLAISLIVGLLFKLMHWPYATIILITATTLFTVIYVPIYFITGIRKPNKKFNVAVNSVLMLACGGIFYSLFNLGYSQKYEQLVTSERVYLADNLQNIKKSNQRLLSFESENTEANRFHEQSLQVAAGADNLMALMETRSSSKTLQETSLAFDQLLRNYNQHIDELRLDGLTTVEFNSDNSFHDLKADLLRAILVRVKQQIAVNENYYLVHLRK